MEAGRAFVAANQIAPLTASVAAVAIMAASRSSIVRMLWLLVGLTRCLAAVGRPNQCLYNLRHVRSEKGTVSRAMESCEQCAPNFAIDAHDCPVRWYSRASIRQNRSHCGTFLRLRLRMCQHSIFAVDCRRGCVECAATQLCAHNNRTRAKMITVNEMSREQEREPVANVTERTSEHKYLRPCCCTDGA